MDIGYECEAKCYLKEGAPGCDFGIPICLVLASLIFLKSIYRLSRKWSLTLNSKLLYEMGHYFLDIQYVLSLRGYIPSFKKIF